SRQLGNCKRRLQDGSTCPHAGTRGCTESVSGLGSSPLPGATHLRLWGGGQGRGKIYPLPELVRGILGDNWSNNPPKDEAAQNSKAAAPQRGSGISANRGFRCRPEKKDAQAVMIWRERNSENSRDMEVHHAHDPESTPIPSHIVGRHLGSGRAAYATGIR